MSTGMDLLLLAIDPDSGQARFGPELSYALPVAELVDLVHARRVGLRDNCLAVADPAAPGTGDELTDAALAQLAEQRVPLTVADWTRWRGPRHIDPYLSAAVSSKIVRIVTEGSPPRTVLAVTDPGPIRAVTTRLIAVLDDPAPGSLDVAFAVLAGAAGLARPHLHGWDQHKHRARLSELGRHAVAGEAASILDSGTKAIAQLSRLAETDPRTIDQRIGLTPAGRTAAVWFGGGAP